MVKQNSSKKSKQSHKTNHKSEHTDKNKQTVGKRQPSGYLMFCAEQREIRKNDLEKMKPKEIMQHLGAEWRKLSIQQQESYKAKAPIKANHDVSNKEELKSQKSQQTHAKSTSSRHHSGTKTKSNTIHKTSTKSASKKKTNTKKIKHTHEKSNSRKLAHHHEDNHENDVCSSE
ncbi:unnamed protein product [Rotaria sordida]|uniref:HMG box domain-containing protein n=1 Tax=Rotaria sordida TaxID=392033 RepID=A0A818QKW0_9BILA|nr:unnamed protein product [Rotaria sordida]